MAITPPRIYTKLLAKGEKNWNDEEREIMKTLGKTDLRDSSDSFLETFFIPAFFKLF